MQAVIDNLPEQEHKGGMETATLETQQNTAQASLNDGKTPLKRGFPPFTTEIARELAAKSHEARRQNRAKQLANTAKLQSQLDQAQPIAQAMIEQAKATQAAITVEPDEVYRLKSLKRVREQLDMLNTQLEQCDAPRDLKAISDAIARLCDVEQKLAGRPLPGSRRPGREKPTKQASDQGPID